MDSFGNHGRGHFRFDAHRDFVDELSRLTADDVSAHQQAGFPVYDEFHEPPAVLVDERTAEIAGWILGDAHLDAFGARFRLGHPDAADFRFAKSHAGHDAVVRGFIVLVTDVAADHIPFVRGSVSKLPVRRGVPGGPDVGFLGLQIFVEFELALRREREPGRLQFQIRKRGAAPRGNHHFARAQFLLPGGGLDAHDFFLAIPADVDDFHIHHDFHALVLFEMFLHDRGDFALFPLQDLRALLQQRDFDPEAREHLGKLRAHRPSADDDDGGGQLCQPHGLVRHQEPGFFKPGNRRNEFARPGGNQDMRGRVFFIPDHQLVVRNKIRPAPKQINTRVMEVALDARAGELVHHRVAVFGDFGEIKTRVVRINTKGRRIFYRLIDLRGIEKRLGGHAGVIRTVAAQFILEFLDDSHFLPGRLGDESSRAPGRAGTDSDEVVVVILGHFCFDAENK